MDKKIIVLVVLGSVVLLVGGFFLAARQPSPNTNQSEGDVLSTSGIHWHPHLTIKIKGKEQTIPKDIGIGAIHAPIHTHDASGTLHLEFGGLVTEDEVRLKNFFKIWGKRFDRECILDNCNGPNGKMKFFVNGKESDEFENYMMQDGDQIEIRYE